MRAATDSKKLKLYVAKITKPAPTGFLLTVKLIGISMV